MEAGEDGRERGEGSSYRLTLYAPDSRRCPPDQPSHKSLLLLLVVAEGDVMQRLCIALGQSIITRQLIQQAATTTTTASNTSLSSWLITRLRLRLVLLLLLHGLCQGSLCGSKVYWLQQRSSTRGRRQEALSTCTAGSRRGWRQSVDGTRDAHVRWTFAEALRLRVIWLGTRGTLLRGVEHIGGALCSRHLKTWWRWAQRGLCRLCVLYTTWWLSFFLLILHILWLWLWLRLWSRWQRGGLWAWLMLRTLYTLSSGGKTVKMLESQVGSGRRWDSLT